MNELSFQGVKVALVNNGKVLTILRDKVGYNKLRSL